jgi:signal transduction histidine kinase/ligand-binding sensor domain-containing protein
MNARINRGWLRLAPARWPRWPRGLGAAFALLFACLLAGDAAAAIEVEAWYHLNENTLPQDVSGHERHFRFSMPGNTYPGPDGAGGPLGESNYFSTASLEFGREDISGFWDNGYTPPDDNVGIEVWVKPIGTGCLGSPRNPNGWILATGSKGGINLAASRQGRSTVFVAGINLKAYVGRPVLADPNRWTHLALVRDRGQTTFYVDGVPCGDPSPAVPNPASPIHVGVTADGAAGFKGLIDEVRIFTFKPGEFRPKDLLLRSLAPASGPPAQVETVPVLRYSVQSWQSDSGLPENTVTSLAQTPDGFLWVGTMGGLARFDGAQFRVFNAASTPALGSGRIRALSSGRGGALWITTLEGTVAKFADGQFVALSLPPIGRASTPPAVRDVIEGADGMLWLLTEAGELARWSDGQCAVVASSTNRLRFLMRGPRAGSPLLLDRGKLCTVAKEQGLVPAFEPPSGPPGFVLFPGAAGSYWFASRGKVQRWRDGQSGVQAGRTVETIPALMGGLEDREGRVWLATLDRGLLCWDTRGGVMEFTKREGLGSDTILTVFEDAAGGIWAGTDGGGLSRLSPALFAGFGRAQGLSSDRVSSVCEGASGTLWAGTDDAGLNQFRPGIPPLVVRGPDNALLCTAAVLRDRKGNVWAGSPTTGLWVGTDGNFRRPDNFPGAAAPVRSLFEDAAGKLWVGRSRTHNLVTLENGAATELEFPAEMPVADVCAMAQGAEQDLWVGTEGQGLLRWHDGSWKRYTKADGLGSDLIWSLCAGNDGALWVGTFGGGLSCFKNGRITTCTTREGLEDNVITQIADDGREYFWFGSHRGVFRVRKPELTEFAEGRRSRIQCIPYGKSDGLPSLECAGGAQPAGCRTSDGRLWFPTLQGVAMVNPSAVRLDPNAPPVHVDELLVDGEPRPFPPELATSTPRAPALSFSTGNRRYRFHFTGVAFSAPEALRFRTQLEGWESGWTEADRERVASYGPLKAGKYRFRVQARSRDGVWSEPGDALSFIVRPRLYETGWFQGAALGSLALGLGFVVRTASNRRLRRQLELVEMQTAVERERARIAQDIHDDLGASLTRITLLSDIAREAAVAGGIGGEMEQIHVTSRDLTRAMGEIVWAVDPEHDTLDSLADYLGKAVQDLLQPANIRCRLVLPADLPAHHLSSQVRHNLFLATKEAVHNAVKHSGATEVRLQLDLEPKSFTLQVADDGRGFALPPAGAGPGHGLNNMSKRLQEIGGRCQVTSQPGQGTVVRFQVPLS